MNFVKKHLFPSQIHNLAEWRWIVVFLEKLDINLFACPYCLTYFLAQSKDRIFWKFEFLFHEDTGVWNQDTMGFRCACTFRHLIIVKKLTNVLLTFTCSILVNYILNLSWHKFQFCNFKLVIRQWGGKCTHQFRTVSRVSWFRFWLLVTLGPCFLQHGHGYICPTNLLGLPINNRKPAIRNRYSAV